MRQTIAEMTTAAEENGQLYRFKPNWQRTIKALAVVISLPIITLPLGIYFWRAANRSYVAVTDEGFVLKTVITKVVHWDEVQALYLHSDVTAGESYGAWAAGAELLRDYTSELTGPIGFQLYGGAEGQIRIPAHALENSLDLAEALESTSGLELQAA